MFKEDELLVNESLIVSQIDGLKEDLECVKNPITKVIIQKEIDELNKSLEAVKSKTEFKPLKSYLKSSS